MTFLEILNSEKNRDGCSAEYAAYNKELGTYVDVSHIKSSSQTVNDILSASYNVKLKRKLFNDVVVYRMNINHEESEYESIRNDVIEDVENEFNATNNIIKNKFKQLDHPQAITPDEIIAIVEYSNNLIEYTIKNLLNKYTDSTYQFNYIIVRNLVDQNNPFTIIGMGLHLIIE